MRSLALLLSVLCAPVAAQSFDLHTLRVAPRGDVVVVYSKPFATCAHLVTPSLQLAHAANIFCTLGNQVAGVFARSSFNANLVVGNPLRLCNGNNYGQCTSQVTVSTGPTLSADRWNLSLAAGGTQTFTIDAGAAYANRSYLVLGSATGTTGFSYGALQIPLDLDGYFGLTLTGANAFPFTNTFARLDANGLASAGLTLPPGLSSALIGLVLHHAFVVLAPSGPLDVSNSWPLTLRS